MTKEVRVVPDGANPNNCRVIVGGEQWCKVYGFTPDEAKARAERLVAALDAASRIEGLEAEEGWLVERWNSRTGEFGAWWWTLDGQESEGQGHWTTVSSIALRFARERDAAAYIEEAGWTEAKPTHHAWSVGPTSPRAPNHPGYDRVLLLASYCGDDNPNCSEDFPCDDCLLMDNIVIMRGDIEVVGDFGLLRDRARALQLDAKAGVASGEADAKTGNSGMPS